MSALKRILLAVYLTGYNFMLCLGCVVSVRLTALVFFCLARLAHLLTRNDLHSGIYFLFPFTTLTQWRAYTELIRDLIRLSSWRETFMMGYYKYRIRHWSPELSLPYFKFPGLSDRDAFWDPSDFPDLQVLLEARGLILNEYREAVNLLKPYTNEAGQVHSDWQTILLYGAGVLNKKYEDFFPGTLRLIGGINDLESSMIMFSVLKPGARIPEHSGPFNAFLRVHVPLILPDQQEHCRIRVGTESRCWTDDRLLIFDDSFLHAVQNDTEQQRVIFMLSVWKPGMDPAIKSLVVRMIALLNSSPPFKKWMEDNS